ncbi:MAG TPA: HDOD domain-containing protein [candidate division Zixibacteria bacterium]|nr:HDOD domain-containing protein [candidate division Zixibacteria bacterium]
MTEGAQELFSQILRENPELSSLPQTLAQVISLSNNENASINDLAAVIEKDPGLAVRVLRAANSPYYGHVREITSVRHAAQTVGFRAVISFALASSVYSLTQALKGGINRPRFWRHSLEVAVAARLVAEKIPGVSADEAFVAGLLHDIGMLVFDNSFPNRYSEIMHEVEAGGVLSVLEIGEWGACHAAAGKFLLDQWDIPESISRAVGRHHMEGGDIDRYADDPLSLSVALANSMSRHRMFDRSGDDVTRFERRAAVNRVLQFSQQDLVDIDEKLAEEFIQQATFLQIDVGDRAAMLQDANRALYGQYLLVERLLDENRALQEHLVQERAKREILKKMRAISGSYNHYLNNATATIQGNVQVLQLRAEKGEITDATGAVAQSVAIIKRTTELVNAVLEAIEEMVDFETKRYHDELEIIDLESKISQRREALDRLSAELTGSD